MSRYSLHEAMEFSQENNKVNKEAAVNEVPSTHIPIDNDYGIPSRDTSKGGRNRPTDNSPADIDPNRSHKKNPAPFQQLENIINWIERIGIPTKWERSYPCPCFSVTTNQPNPNCKLCNGIGLLYKDPHYLQVAYQSNEKGAYSGVYGLSDLGTTLGTPQITEAGIENGISFRDRLTINGLTVAQTYLFNVTESRCLNGKFIPYKVADFNGVFTINKNNGLLEEIHQVQTKEALKNQTAFYYESVTNKLFVSKTLVGQNITMSLTCPLRYYVVDLRRETRYAQVQKLAYKERALNKGDKKLTNYINDYEEAIKPGIIYVRLPKLLVLRREDLVQSNVDYTDANGNEQSKEFDPKYPSNINTGGSSISSWLQGDH